MIEVVSIKFKTCGKQYFFSPGELSVARGQKVIVETAKGMEMAECARENHMVEDTAVVQPLRSVIRIATEQDIRTAEQIQVREQEAFQICKQKIQEHGLDMKLVSVECSFEGTKTMFFFTSDGRVDFRELVKDLAGVFHNRIELRQIGVRDEAKMIGGIAICGRPYCCNQFLDDFAPVSTKMAKVQSLSLNPTKISGSCGRLMCCLRYEEEAYEDLLKHVPKQGAFVQTADGYGTVVSVSLLRQHVKVRLDGTGEEELRLYCADEIVSIPGGRPAEGEPYPDLLKDLPVKVKEEPLPEEKDSWSSPSLFGYNVSAEKTNMSADRIAPENLWDTLEEEQKGHSKSHSRNHNRRPGRNENTEDRQRAETKPENRGERRQKTEQPRNSEQGKPARPKQRPKPNQKAGRDPDAALEQRTKKTPGKQKEHGEQPGRKPEQKRNNNQNRTSDVKKAPARKETPDKTAAFEKPEAPVGTGENGAEKKKRNYGNRHRFYGSKNKGPGKPAPSGDN